jgi:hypothetical protein
MLFVFLRVFVCSGFQENKFTLAEAKSSDDSNKSGRTIRVERSDRTDRFEQIVVQVCSFGLRRVVRRFQLLSTYRGVGFCLYYHYIVCVI